MRSRQFGTLFRVNKQFLDECPIAFEVSWQGGSEFSFSAQLVRRSWFFLAHATLVVYAKSELKFSWFTWTQCRDSFPRPGPVRWPSGTRKTALDRGVPSGVRISTRFNPG